MQEDNNYDLAITIAWLFLWNRQAKKIVTIFPINVVFLHRLGCHKLVYCSMRSAVEITTEDQGRSLNTRSHIHFFSLVYLVYTEFILVRLWTKLLAYRNTLESVPGTNQYWAISVKFLAQAINGLSLTGFEPKQLAILRLLVWHVNHLTMPPRLLVT